MTAKKTMTMSKGRCFTLVNMLAESLATNKHPGCGLSFEEEAMLFAAAAGSDIPQFVLWHAVLSRAGWLRITHALSFYRHHNKVVLDNPTYTLEDAAGEASQRSWWAVQNYLEGHDDSWATSRYPAVVAEIDEIAKVLPNGGAA